mgnify:CR=1 FL=1
MKYTFEKDQLVGPDKTDLREWVITNGLGSYCGTSLNGALSRTHQGCLIASLHSPTERYLCLSKIDEKVGEISLATNQYKGKTFDEGSKWLTKAEYDGNMHFHYEADEFSLEKIITLEAGVNRVHFRYIVNNEGKPTLLTLTPFFNFRDHSGKSDETSLNFNEEVSSGLLRLVPTASPEVTIRFNCNGGHIVPRTEKIRKDIELQIEVDLENEGLEDHYVPYDISYEIPTGLTTIDVCCEVSLNDTVVSPCTFDPFEARLEHLRKLEVQSGLTDDFALRLIDASDAFIAYRASTGYDTVLAGLPWFTDWGRDTMISFCGLTLVTRRFKEARGILYTFAKYIKNGIVPNMFPDDGMAPLYNTADASLWFFYAVYKYLEYDNSPEGAAFIKKEIYPKLFEIVEAYKNGTDNSIYMDKDGLICAGDGLDQVTWMDVRVGEFVPTPRHGKPVEINALWINALHILAELMGRFNDEGFEKYENLAQTATESFNRLFWCEEKSCLYDVIEKDGTPDDHFRCNQLYAVSLPFSILPPDKERNIVDFCQKELYVGVGIRTLTCDHKDYHPLYDGALEKRDRAYHQGTAWGYVLGAFITAYVKTHGKSERTRQEALNLLAPVKTHMYTEGCIGSINEVFWGDAPHKPRGCYAQAWSVAEVLRALYEDILS